MLSGFLTQLGGFFDRRFLLAYWMPTFITLALLALGGAAAQLGAGDALAAWAALDPLMQVIIGLAALIGITVLAFGLQALTTPIVRLYEGYWPDNWLRRWAEGDQRASWQKINVQITDKTATAGLHRHGAYRSYYFDYPRDPALLRATRLGNTLSAAEEYSSQAYGLDSVLWWPRLTPLLPETLRSQIDAALTPMLALLNLSFLLTLFALFGGLALLLDDWFFRSQPLWLYALVLGGGLVLARFCYVGAVSQAGEYGDLIRVAFDLHRRKLLEAMNVPLPAELMDERELWTALNQFVYFYTPPPQANLDPDGHQYVSDQHFRFDNYKPPASPPPPDQPQRIILEVRGAPYINIRRMGG